MHFSTVLILHTYQLTFHTKPSKSPSGYHYATAQFILMAHFTQIKLNDYALNLQTSDFYFVIQNIHFPVHITHTAQTDKDRTVEGNQ